MKINTLELRSFGKFSNKTLTLAEGFNIIYGDNGAGKTTITDFIRLMFYGSCGSDRSRDISKNPRRKYLPWNGTPMSGAVTFEHGGHSYILSRNFGKTPSSDKVSLFDVTDGKDLPAKSSDNFGLRFFGMELDEFERTVFVGTPAFDSDYSGTALASKISNLSISGDENISEETVLKRLSSAKESLISKNGKKGIVIDARAQLEKLYGEHSLALSELEHQSDTAEKLSHVRTEIAELERELDAAGKFEKQSALSRELKTYKYIEEKHLSLNTALETIRSSGAVHSFETVHDSYSADILRGTLGELDSQISECRLLAAKLNESENAAKAEADAPNKSKHTALSATAVVFAVLSVAALAARFAHDSFVFSAVGAAAFILCLITVLRIPRGKHKHDTPPDMVSELCLKLGALCGTEIPDNQTALNRLSELSAALDNAVSALNDITAAACASEISDFGYDTVRSEITKAESVLDNFRFANVSSQSAAELGAKLIEKRRTADALRLAFVPPKTDLHAIEDKISELDRRVSELEKQYRILCIAEEVMLDAAYETRRGLGTRLSLKTTEYLAEFSDSFADKTAVSDSLDISVLPFGDAEFHSRHYLSNGQTERVYLALRLAAADIMVSDHGSVPLVLDDAFSHCDDKSCQKALAFLGEYLKDSGSASQIILFTCHGSVADFAANTITNSVKIKIE